MTDSFDSGPFWVFWDSSGESAQGAAHLQSPAQLRGRGYVTIAGTWQDLRDQMSLKPRDPRKKCAGSRDSDHIIKNYWESGLGLFTIAFSGDFDPRFLHERAPRGPTRSAPALTSDCNVCINQPRTHISFSMKRIVALRVEFAQNYSTNSKSFPGEQAVACSASCALRRGSVCAAQLLRCVPRLPRTSLGLRGDRPLGQIERRRHPPQK